MTLNLDRVFASVHERMEQHPGEIRPFVEWLISRKRPQHVLEIGVRHGGTAALWHQISTGHVIGVDCLGPDSLSREGFDALAIAMEHRYPRYTFIEGDSHDAQTFDRVKRVLGAQKLDLLFLDGDHSYNGLQQDWMMYTPLLHVGGIIAVHDINADLKYGHGVGKFWNELNVPHKKTFSVNGEWGGIGAWVGR